MAYSPRVQSLVEGKAWWKERKVTGHFVPTARKQRVMNLGPQLFLFYSVQDGL